MKNKNQIQVQVRGGTFETNSSSLHAIAILNEHHNNPPLEPEYEDERIHVTLGEYYGEEERFRDLYHKLSYLLTFIKCTEYYDNGVATYGEYHETENPNGFNFDSPFDLKLFMETDGFRSLDAEVYSYCGYHLVPDDPYKAEIDHQAFDHATTIEGLMRSWRCTLHDFLFDTAYMVVISMDGGPYPTVEEVNSWRNGKDWIIHPKTGKVCGFDFYDPDFYADYRDDDPTDCSWEDDDEPYDNGDENITRINRHKQFRAEDEPIDDSDDTDYDEL